MKVGRPTTHPVECVVGRIPGGVRLRFGVSLGLNRQHVAVVEAIAGVLNLAVNDSLDVIAEAEGDLDTVVRDDGRDGSASGKVQCDFAGCAVTGGDTHSSNYLND